MTYEEMEYAYKRAINHVNELVIECETELAIKNNALKRSKNKNKRYREDIESISDYLDSSEAEKEVQLHNVHIFAHDLLEGEKWLN